MEYFSSNNIGVLIQVIIILGVFLFFIVV
jgi:hypothetical protein